jgi:hypothetical protein
VESLLTSPALIDLIVLFTVIEAVVLILWRRRVAAVALLLLPGVCLLLAARAALAGAPWPWVPLALTGALVAHLLDLRWRWRSQGL